MKGNVHFLCLAFGLLLLFGLLWLGSSSGQMIADITQDVHTEFGVYHPYLVEVEPSVEPYTIDPDFGNVVNYGDFSFTEVEDSLLLANGFVVSPGRDFSGSGYMEIYDIYNECRERGIPIFVTTDALLHTYHRLYDYILRKVELKRFFADLDGLNRAMLARAEAQYYSATYPTVREAARKDVAYFAVATILLDSTSTAPPYVEDLVDAELVLIESHSGFPPSPIFQYLEDYSQYKPRGHYTINDSLKSYFRTMMWYGRMAFACDTTGYPGLTSEATRQALLLVQALNSDSPNGEPATDVWERIYSPTVFFVGKTDDINIYAYTDLMSQIYGADFVGLPVDSFANDALLSQFIDAASGLPGPEIPSLCTPVGFRFMGQGYIPDSYMLSHLTDPWVSGRFMPKGLDVMAVLGSERAYEILDQIYNETSYPGYNTQMDSLKQRYASLPDTLWARNLYYNWLYSLMPLLFVKGEGYPFFMQNGAWVDKELSASCGSWAELRHDTILYAKQSMTIGGELPASDLVKGYVEPNPYLFARLASLASFMLVGLENRDLLYADFGGRLSELDSLLLSLKLIAEKELTNQPITDEEEYLICDIGNNLEDLVSVGDPQGEGPMRDETPDPMPVIADVHTDLFSGNCLEEGVGYPFTIYVIVPIDGELKVTRGAVFSYYEFQQPISNRLTDEQWRQLLQGDPPPQLPVWLASFIDVSQGLANSNPDHYYWGNYGLTVKDPDKQPNLPYSFALLQNYPNPFNLTTAISYRLSGSGPCRTTIRVYNLLGQLVRTLVDGEQEPGYHSVRWDGRNGLGKDVSSGIYFYKLQAGDYTSVRKMILLK